MNELQRVAETFQTSGLPQYSYFKRHSRKELQGFAMFMCGTSGVFAVQGLSKSGKTVFLRKELEDEKTIWIDGPTIHSVDELWNAIESEVGRSFSDRSTVTEENQRDAGAGVTLGIGGSGISAGVQSGAKQSVSHEYHRSSVISRRAVKSLSDSRKTLVIDDFHLLKEEARHDVVTALKTLNDTCRVIVVSVPYEIFDLNQQVPDFASRVEFLRFERWTPSDLAKIGVSGLEHLGIDCDRSEISEVLAEWSFGSPLNMQRLCRYFVAQMVADGRTFNKEEWAADLHDVAAATEPRYFRKTRLGPKERSRPRISYDIPITEHQVDVYDLVLLALAGCSDPWVTTETEIRQVLDSKYGVCPQAASITQCLERIEAAAGKDLGRKEDRPLYLDDRMIYLADPDLVFYLRHSNWIETTKKK